MSNRGGGKRFYAVAIGRAPGVYDTPAEADAQVLHYSGALHQRFKNFKSADAFVRSRGAGGAGVSVGGSSIGGRSLGGGRSIGGRSVGGGRSVSGRSVSGRSVSGRSVSGRSVRGRSVGGRSVGGRSIGSRSSGRGRKRGRRATSGGYYAVAIGHHPGVYDTWAEAAEQVLRYSGALFKKFSTFESADEFVRSRGVSGDGGRSVGDRTDHESDDDGYYDQGAQRRFPPKAFSEHGPAPRRFVLRFDGGARSNPGPAGGGTVITDSSTGATLYRGSAYFGDPVTNNEAEYRALLAGLRTAIAMGITVLDIEGDSELVVRQVTGRCATSKRALQELRMAAVDLLARFTSHTLTFIRRKHNSTADGLANVAMHERRDSMWCDAKASRAAGLTPVYH
jgi:ribonuclease HI